MNNGPPSRDRRSLQDLAKLANAPSLSSNGPASVPGSVPSSKTPPPPPVSIRDPDHDSGIVDLKQIAQVDHGAEARSKTTPLASSPLFEDETPPIQAPSSRPLAGANGPVSGRASSPAALASSPSLGGPISGPVSSQQPPNTRVTAAAVTTTAAPAKSSSPLWIGGVVLLGAVAAGVFFLRGSTEAPSPVSTPVAAATPTTAPVVPSSSPAATTAPPEASAAAVPAASPKEEAPKGGTQAGPTRKTASGSAPSNQAKAAPAENPGGSGVSPLGAMMAQASGGSATAPVANQATATLSAGSLGDAVQHAVGGGGAAAPVSQAPADTPQFAPGSVPEKPSQGAVTGALGRALPAARSCLNPDDPVSRASVTFTSAGTVSGVVVTGSAAGKPAEGCIKEALMKATVAPFAQATYAATVTVRPN